MPPSFGIDKEKFMSSDIMFLSYAYPTVCKTLVKEQPPQKGLFTYIIGL